ncbi:MAG TPA: transcription termination/antitermination NusG family protein [Pyrinomonadaceae bacterium]
MSSETSLDGKLWYAVHAKPGQEDRAESNLRAWGVETFNPRVRGCRYNEFTGKPTYFTKPLFPRYLFARFDVERLLYKVSFTRGVSDVVNFGEGPSPIEDEIIEVMRARVGADGFVRIGDKFEAGDRVVVKDGPLANLIGIFEGEVNEDDRVRILLTTLNYQGSAVIKREHLRKAS